MKVDRLVELCYELEFEYSIKHRHDKDSLVILLNEVSFTDIQSKLINSMGVAWAKKPKINSWFIFMDIKISYSPLLDNDAEGYIFGFEKP